MAEKLGDRIRNLWERMSQVHHAELIDLASEVAELEKRAVPQTTSLVIWRTSIGLGATAELVEEDDPEHAGEWAWWIHGLPDEDNPLRYEATLQAAIAAAEPPREDRP